MPGTQFTVSGIGFDTNPDKDILTIGGTTVPVASATLTSLTATMPDDFPSGVYPVSVTARGQTAKFDGTVKVISVYVAGSESVGPGVGFNKSIGKYWKNLVATNLTTAVNSASTGAGDIFVNGKDVHIVGVEWRDDAHNRAVYWKNGVPTYLTDTNFGSEAHSVVVTPAGDVYVGGNYYSFSSGVNHQIITYWKNGIKQNDITDGSQYAYSSALDASDTDVVIVGQDTLYGPTKYWRNGVPTILNPSLNLATGAILNNYWDIKLIGTDVYVAGGTLIDPTSTTINPEYWLNGIGTTLSSFPISSPGSNVPVPWATSIAISGSDIYFGGSMVYNNDSYGACYWKLGATPFVSVTDPKNSSVWAYDIAVSGSDVFIVGSDLISGQTPRIAKLWINGLEYKLTDGTRDAGANHIFIQ
jgi:hypothetical protein